MVYASPHMFHDSTAMELTACHRVGLQDLTFKFFLKIYIVFLALTVVEKTPKDVCQTWANKQWVCRAPKTIAVRCDLPYLFQEKLHGLCISTAMEFCHCQSLDVLFSVSLHLPLLSNSTAVKALGRWSAEASYKFLPSGEGDSELGCLDNTAGADARGMEPPG